jgi:hypothetical protein
MAMGDSVREAMHNAQYGTARREDAVTRTVESQTTAIPSIAFLGVAMGSMALSLALLLTGRRQGRELHRAMGADHSDHGSLQQAGETARKRLPGRDRRELR